MNWLGGAAIGALVLVAARRLGWLTRTGQLAAAPVGLAVLLGSGGSGLALLLAFFLTASVLSRFRAEAKPGPKRQEGRSAKQVMANGGVTAAVSLAALAGWVPAAHYALIGAVAAATADTWATEIGSAGSWPTWSVIGGGRVPAGRSGGVSLPGTLAGVAGALAIGLLAWRLPGWAGAPPTLAVVAGTAGMFADSLLGATLEDRLGVLGNDGVNLGCTLAGAATALVLSGISPW